MRVAAGPRQLSLFKRKNQRGLAAPSPSEFATQCALADTLRRWARPEVWWSHIGHGEKRDIVTASRLKRMGLRAGMADFIFITPWGIHFLELKRKGGKLSDEQISFETAALTAGAYFAMASSYEEAIGILKDWNCFARTIHALPINPNF